MGSDVPQGSVADFPKKLRFLFEPHRYKVAHGGRGGAKSWGFARALLIKAGMARLRVLCARELQISIQDSVHKLLGEQIQSMGLASFYDVQQASIRGSNGSEFIFSGLRSNITRIKSMEGVDICWVEEAQTVSEESWSVLVPTIRKDASEIWVSFNPDLDSDPTYKRFIVDPPPGACVVEIGWQDNPWLPDVLKEEKDYLYRIDSEAAAHVWGGKTRRNSAASVLRGRYRVESFTPGADWNGPYFGADWGFGVDPTALVRCWVSNRVLYVESEAYGVGIDLDDTPALFDRVPGAREHTIRADNSRPETISHMRRHGYARMVGCTKGPGSVEDGVEHLRSYESIIIHPRCLHAAEEARLWSYKVDKLTGDVMPALLDKHNHCMDALRYALEPIIRAGKPTADPVETPKKRHDYDIKRGVQEAWKIA
jgi:phage terminase large subunit